MLKYYLMNKIKRKDLIGRTTQNYYEHEFIKDELRKNVVELKILGITRQEITEHELEDIFAEFSGEVK